MKCSQPFFDFLLFIYGHVAKPQLSAKASMYSSEGLVVGTFSPADNEGCVELIRGVFSILEQAGQGSGKRISAEVVAQLKGNPCLLPSPAKVPPSLSK